MSCTMPGSFASGGVNAALFMRRGAARLATPAGATRSEFAELAAGRFADINGDREKGGKGGDHDEGDKPAGNRFTDGERVVKCAERINSGIGIERIGTAMEKYFGQPGDQNNGEDETVIAPE